MKEKEIINTSEDKGFFKSFIPLSVDNGKIKVFEKEFDGIKKKYLRGIASNTLIDKEDERMSKNFIEKIKQSAMGLNVFSEHDHNIDKTVGFIDSVGGDSDNVILDVSLEDENENLIVKNVLNKIKHGTKIGYSIGGRILKAKKYFDDAANKWIKEIEDGEIYEISLTAMPAGEGTWVEPIQKSLNKDFEFGDLGNETDDKDFKKIFTNNSKTTTVEMDEIKKHIIEKTLDEMLQANQVQDELWDLFYAFRSAIYSIIDSDQLTPQQKKTSITNLSSEFGAKVEEISTTISELAIAIEEQIGTNIK